MHSRLHRSDRRIEGSATKQVYQHQNAFITTYFGNRSSNLLDKTAQSFPFFQSKCSHHLLLTDDHLCAGQQRLSQMAVAYDQNGYLCHIGYCSFLWHFPNAGDHGVISGYQHNLEGA